MIERQIEENGFIIHKINGDSMMPMLDQKNDLVRIEKCKGPLSLYDVPLYKRSNGQYVLHRIIKVKKDCYITCGDNRWQPEIVKPEQIIGVLTGFYKSGKYIEASDKEYLKYVSKVTKGRLKRRYSYYKTRLAKKDVVTTAPKEFYALMTLYKAALTNSVGKIDDGVDFETVFSLSKAQGITAVCFSALDHYKDKLSDELYAEWRKKAYEVKAKHILFDVERKAICEYLNKANIKHILLKGILIKDVYPIPMSREFADNDIFIDVEKAKDVETFMTSRGYEGKCAYEVHDSYTKLPVYNFEFHKKLFDVDHTYGSIFADPFSYSNVVNGSEYVMPKEYFLAYFVAHFDKHFSGSGSGLRYFGDYYLLKKSIGDEFDFELYNKLIRDSGLTDFVEMIDKVIDSIFNECSIDEEIILYIYKSSMYGSNRLRIKNGIKKYGRFKYMLRLFFLPYRSMAQNYHVLKYLPFLLPVMWLVRFVRFCFRGQSSLSTIKSLID